MNSDRKIQKALISVYDKNLILDIANELVSLGVEILSTGGTQQYLGSHNIPVTAVEDLTGYPSIFGGRVKTLHPKIMGGILYRREEASDVAERERYDIPGIDLVIVDLYPFEEYVAKDASEEDIIEKIDIGGISLIRAAAKNYNDVIIVAGKESYSDLLTLLREKKGHSSIEDRRAFAAKAFLKSSNYDTHIFQYFNRKEQIPAFTASETRATHLRYGENPHQKALYFGSETSLPEQLHGKEISYNNMLDIEAALELISDFDETAVAVHGSQPWPPIPYPHSEASSPPTAPWTRLRPRRCTKYSSRWSSLPITSQRPFRYSRGRRTASSSGLPRPVRQP